MIITEIDACILTGDVPRWSSRALWTKTKPLFLIPGRVLPPETTDALAENERALYGADEWSRDKKGNVILWVEM